MKPNYIKVISTFIYLLINCLFVFKYSSRVFEYPILLVGIYTVFVLSFILLIARPNTFNDKITNKFFFVFSIAVSICMALLMILTDDLNIRVGRYQAINLWIENFLSGNFPYGILEYHNPSGFPFLFFLLMPFYFLGNLGILQFLSFILFIYLIYKQQNQNSKQLYFNFGLLVLAPIFWYEVVTRSELFFNMVLVLALLFFVKLSEEKIKSSLKLFIFIGILSGLLLSTRAVVLIVLILFFSFLFSHDIKKLFLFFLIVVGTFIITILPFYIWNPTQFIEKGPFAIQSIYLHPILVLIFLIIAFFIGWKSATERNLYFKIAILLFVIVACSFVQSLFEYSLNELIFNNRFDIAYFIFPLPFLLINLE